MLYVTILPFDFVVFSYGFYQGNFVTEHTQSRCSSSKGKKKTGWQLSEQEVLMGKSPR